MTFGTHYICGAVLDLDLVSDPPPLVSLQDAQQQISLFAHSSLKQHSGTKQICCLSSNTAHFWCNDFSQFSEIPQPLYT